MRGERLFDIIPRHCGFMALHQPLPEVKNRSCRGLRGPNSITSSACVSVCELLHVKMYENILFLPSFSFSALALGDETMEIKIHP